VPVDAVLSRFAAKYLDLVFARTLHIFTYKSVGIVHLATSDSTTYMSTDTNSEAPWTCCFTHDNTTGLEELCASYINACMLSRLLRTLTPLNRCSSMSLGKTGIIHTLGETL
jgi:hypothetical protein